LKSGTSNLYLDEIDKLSVSSQGDPSSALLEVLILSKTIFYDNSCEMGYDHESNVYRHITTMSSDSASIRDRMEIIKMSGYTDRGKGGNSTPVRLPPQRKNGVQKINRTPAVVPVDRSQASDLLKMPKAAMEEYNKKVNEDIIRVLEFQD
jgi:ATP-dependent Lon protease